MKMENALLHFPTDVITISRVQSLKRTEAPLLQVRIPHIVASWEQNMPYINIRLLVESGYASGLEGDQEPGSICCVLASATSHEVAFGFATQLEFLCREQLCQPIEKHQNDGHGHDNHVVADACSNIKPAAIILDQEEKMQSHNV